MDSALNRIVLALTISLALLSSAHAQSGQPKTNSALVSEVNSLIQDNQAGLVTPFDMRQTLLDMLASGGGGGGTISGTTCLASQLTTYQPYANTTSAPTGTTLNIWDGAQCVPWATLNQTTHELTLTGSAGSTLNQALTITQTPSGSASANTSFNSLTLTDGAAISGLNFGVGLNIVHNYGGNSAEGGREALQAAASLTATSSASSSNRNYVGVVGIGQTIANDNGSSPSSNATAAGAFFGGNFVGATLNSAATALLNLTGAEFNTSMVSGSSVWAKSLAQFSSGSGDRVQGTVVDSMLWFYNQSASNPGWNDGILFDGTNGTWPIKSTGTIMAAIGGGTAAHGINLSGVTFTADAFRSAGFSVGPTGVVTATNEILIDGTSSGSGAITVSATGGTLQLGSASTTVDASGDFSSSNITAVSAFAYSAIFIGQQPVTLTGTSGSTSSTSQIINSSGTFTLTLPSASSLTGRWLYVRSIAANAVNSASSNVVPLAGGAAGTAILTATSGKWANLQSDGTNWQVMEAN